MATLYTQQESNNMKTWALMSFMAVLVIGIGWGCGTYFNNPIIFYLAVCLSVGMNIVGYWYSDTIALKMSHAEIADEKEYRDLHHIVENLSIAAGLPKPGVYIIKDMSPNAFAAGRNQKHSVIAVTTGLLSILEQVELEGVIAHELAHIGNKDILISTIAVVLAGFLSIISDVVLRMTLFGGGDDGEKPLPYVLFSLLVILLAPIAGFLIQMAISRKREFSADATGALITRYPEGLIRALLKIEAHANQPMMHTHDATAHLFFSNPFGAQQGEGLHKLFLTHPPIEERVRALRGEIR